MTISNQYIKPSIAIPLGKLACLIGALLSFYTPVSADTVKFDNGDILDGKVQAFEPEKILLQSTMTSDPMQIKCKSVKNIIFSKKEKPQQQQQPKQYTERLTLANNDVIPCHVISMDEKQLHISTRYAGDFSISRTDIRSLQFGTRREGTIFTGHEKPAQWTHMDGEWNLQNGTSHEGIGSLAQKLDLPENVRFQFKLSWKDVPNFAFRFCAENESATTKQDTYELTFNSAGMQIRRYASDNQPAALPAALLLDIKEISPFKVNKKSLDIVIRVNRSDNEGTLYVDSKLIGYWADPLPDSKGSYIVFNNRSEEKENCTISNILVTTLNKTATQRLSDKTSKAITTSDLLIDSEGNNYLGELKSINSSDTNELIITMGVEHTPELLKVPGRRVSILLFAKPDNTSKFPVTTFNASLRDGGQLQLNNPRLVEQGLEMIHPILGPCSLTRESIAQITISREHPEKKPSTTP